TRHTLSDTTSDTRGIGAARRWLRDEFHSIADAAGRADIRVELQTFIQPPNYRIPEEVELANVVMTIPGAMPEARGRVYVVIGHYDSRNSDAMDAEGDAPGANDDGSGTAAVLELARVFAPRPWDATLVFIMSAGEEQGLLGARRFAQVALEEGMDIHAVLSNDIVGDPSGPDGRSAPGVVRLFSEGIPAFPAEGEMNRIRQLAMESDSPSRQLARFVAEVAQRYQTEVQPRLIFRPDRFLRGGDHSAFNEQGFAAVRFTEVYEAYDRQHQDVRMVDGRPYGDTPDFVDAEYLAGVARLNAAALAELASAPRAPECNLVFSGLETTTTLEWAAAPEPDIAGYEVVWRDTTDWQWTHVVDVGNTTSHTLDLSKDNWFFGVRAYDRDGHRSPVSFPGVDRR
ncbi:MAG: M28 family metallopeptidase, partial [Phycisphaerales bacterium]|nr:M28 family metallopeptidase [Phycisphaerales bacterium]